MDTNSGDLSRYITISRITAYKGHLLRAQARASSQHRGGGSLRCSEFDIATGAIAQSWNANYQVEQSRIVRPPHAAVFSDAEHDPVEPSRPVPRTAQHDRRSVRETGLMRGAMGSQHRPRIAMEMSGHGVHDVDHAQTPTKPLHAHTSTEKCS